MDNTAASKKDLEANGQVDETPSVTSSEEMNPYRKRSRRMEYIYISIAVVLGAALIAVLVYFSVTNAMKDDLEPVASSIAATTTESNYDDDYGNSFFDDSALSDTSAGANTRNMEPPVQQTRLSPYPSDGTTKAPEAGITPEATRRPLSAVGSGADSSLRARSLDSSLRARSLAPQPDTPSDESDAANNDNTGPVLQARAIAPPQDTPSGESEATTNGNTGQSDAAINDNAAPPAEIPSGPPLRSLRRVQPPTTTSGPPLRSLRRVQPPTTTSANPIVPTTSITATTTTSAQSSDAEAVQEK